MEPVSLIMSPFDFTPVCADGNMWWWSAGAGIIDNVPLSDDRNMSVLSSALVALVATLVGAGLVAFIFYYVSRKRAIANGTVTRTKLDDNISEAVPMVYTRFVAIERGRCRHIQLDWTMIAPPTPSVCSPH